MISIDRRTTDGLLVMAMVTEELDLVGNSGYPAIDTTSVLALDPTTENYIWYKVVNFNR